MKLAEHHAGAIPRPLNRRCRGQCVIHDDDGGLHIQQRLAQKGRNRPGILVECDAMCNGNSRSKRTLDDNGQQRIVVLVRLVRGIQVNALTSAFLSRTNSNNTKAGIRNSFDGAASRHKPVRSAYFCNLPLPLALKDEDKVIIFHSEGDDVGPAILFVHSVTHNLQ